MPIEPKYAIRHGLHAELLFRAPDGRLAEPDAKTLVVQQFVNCRGESMRIGRWNSEAGYAVLRDERHTGIETCIDDRFTGSHRFDLNDPKGLTACDRRKNKGLNSMVIR